MSDTKISSFLDLPPEIRQSVYDDAYSSQCIVFDVSTSKPLVRRHTDQASDMPASDKNFDALSLVSKQFHQEARPSLGIDCKVVLVAERDAKITPSPNMAGLIKQIEHIEFNSALLAQVDSWPPFEKARKATVKRDIAFQIFRSFGMHRSLNEREETDLVKSEILRIMKHMLDPESGCGLASFNTSVADSATLIVEGQYRARRVVYDPRDSIVFLKMYTGTYRYDVRRKILKLVAPTSTREEVLEDLYENLYPEGFGD